jgi:hypothetical protein
MIVEALYDGSTIRYLGMQVVLVSQHLPDTRLYTVCRVMELKLDRRREAIKPSKSERCIDGVGPIRTTVLPDLNAAQPANVTPCVSTPSILLILLCTMMRRPSLLPSLN